MLRSPAIFIDLCNMGVTRWLAVALGPSLLPSSILCCDARDENIFVDSHFQLDHRVEFSKHLSPSGHKVPHVEVNIVSYSFNPLCKKIRGNNISPLLEDEESYLWNPAKSSLQE